MTTRLPFPTYLEHVRSDSARFLDVLAATDPGARVPSCPDWTAADLLYHLTDVQWFWGTVVANRLTSPQEIEGYEQPVRAPSYPDMLDAMRAATQTLTTALESTPPEATAWTWSTEQTVGFVYRRQAHEALIHRVDAELAGDARTPLDPALACDGVDEALRVMFAGCPPWGTITEQAGRRVRIAAQDTGASWVVTLARLTGTDEEGTVHDEADIVVADDDGEPVLAEVRASAADLDCWLWHRPTWSAPTRGGDPEVLTELEEVLSQPLK
jgi:uncharacterized protein (TIGR03083 family)